MRPTPLGKKTYEEYEKELKEYNLSTQRFDFKDMKTLDKLLKEADKLGSKFKKLKDKAIDAEISWEDEEESVKELKEKYDKSFQNVEKLKAKYEKQRQIVLAGKGEIQSFLLTFRTAVSQVESAGKALGIDVPVDKYKSEINRLDAAQLTYKG
jgi:DNA repair exonuclease SbcCD ATPase subunit